jgi:hypothetical protein
VRQRTGEEVHDTRMLRSRQLQSVYSMCVDRVYALFNTDSEYLSPRSTIVICSSYPVPSCHVPAWLAQHACPPKHLLVWQVRRQAKGLDMNECEHGYRNNYQYALLQCDAEVLEGYRCCNASPKSSFELNRIWLMCLCGVECCCPC